MASKHEMQEVHLRIANSFPHDVVFVLEPWGEEHAFPVGDVIEVVANGPAPGALDLDVTPEAITVWAWAGSTAFLFRDRVEFAGGAERPRVPEYPPSISAPAELPEHVADAAEAPDRLLAAFKDALGQPDIDRGALELYLGRAVVEGLELAKERQAS